MKEETMEKLISEAEIQRRIREMARVIEKDFRDGEMVVVGVLKGAFIFMADLVREIRHTLTCDFLRVSSYDRDRDTGIVRMEFDMTQPVDGKDVLLVEDIVDSGKTLRHLIRHLQMKNPRQLKVATLLYKERGLNARELVDYIGFDCPQRFVIGYGLDSEGKYRSLPYVAVCRD